LNPLLAYFKFWWHSKNEHGVHSPFVFDLVTKCFYDRTKHKAYQQRSRTDSKSKFLIRLSAYFKFESCFIPESISENFEYALNIENKTSKFNSITELLKTESLISKAPCLIYVDPHSIGSHAIADLLNVCHHDSLILIDSIRKNKTQFKRWNQFKSDPQVSVSIDTFYWGLIFLRTAQPKEHFTIRL
jgi:hypothetical protein